MSKLLNELRQLEPNQFQEELAKTYFSNAPSKESHSIQSKPDLKNKKIRYLSLNIIFSSLAAIIVLFFVFNRIAIEIKIIPSFKTNSLNGNRAAEVVYLNKDGELNTDLIRNIVFYENAHNDSGLGKEFVILSNEIPSKKAVLGIDFNKSLNLKKYLFCFYSKGSEGGEAMRISLRDTNNNVCHSSINELGNSWQQFIVDGEEAGDLIDPENVTHVDLEVNPNEKQNMARSTIYLKEIYLAKRRE